MIIVYKSWYLTDGETTPEAAPPPEVAPSSTSTTNQSSLISSADEELSYFGALKSDDEYTTSLTGKVHSNEPTSLRSSFAPTDRTTV